jgi:DNA-binding GntR family transcriptional regulator
VSLELMLAARRWPVDARARHVGMVLGSHANVYGRAWPSWDTLALETGYGRSTIARAILRLEAAGLIERIHRIGRNCEYVFPQAARTSRSDTGPCHSDDHPSRSDTQKVMKEEPERKSGADRPRRLTAAAGAEPIHMRASLEAKAEQIRRRIMGGGE